MQPKSKIFCLGLHKTATLSLAKTLEEFGYKVRHGFKKHSDLIDKAIYKGEPALSILEKEWEEYDAFLDLYAVRYFYPILEKQYPNSKFVLTTRNENDWIKSVHNQIQKRPKSPYFHYWYFQTDNQRRWDKRSSEACIREHFGNKDNFLEINIPENSKQDYSRLCEFLGQIPLRSKFLHENKSN